MNIISLKPFYGVINNDYVKSYILSAKLNSELNRKKNKKKIPIYYPNEYMNIIKEELPTYLNERYYFNYQDSYFYEPDTNNDDKQLNKYDEYERENVEFEENESTDSEEDFIEVY